MNVDLAPNIVVKLIMAAVLGGIIGLERELRHKPAGLRTNMFICFGSALFTILSDEIGRRFGGDNTRIVAQLIPGIGFIGAGSIIHARGSVTGLTTAATIFVMASIGMAVGGGLYWTAIFATLLILGSLSLLGWAEKRYSLKTAIMSYRISCPDLEHMVSAVNQILNQEQLSMQRLQCIRGEDTFAIEFDLDVAYHLHQDLVRRFAQIEKVCEVTHSALAERE